MYSAARSLPATMSDGAFAEETAIDFVFHFAGIGDIVPSIDRVEIGYTWYAARCQRTHVNTEAKYLMLRHAFEIWGCQRVEFKTDSLNERSRAALLRRRGGRAAERERGAGVDQHRQARHLDRRLGQRSVGA